MRDDIEGFLAELAAAERTGDTDKLDVLLTEDFVGIGPLGFSLPKAAWLARHGQGLRYELFRVEDAEVHDHDQVAIVTARYSQRGSAFGNPIPEAARATLVLVRHQGDWRLSNVHMSFIAGTPGAPAIPGPPAGEPGLTESSQ